MLEAIATGFCMDAGGEFVRQRKYGARGDRHRNPAEILWLGENTGLGGDRHRNPAEILWLGENTGLGGDRVFAQNGAADDGGKMAAVKFVNAKNIEL